MNLQYYRAESVFNFRIKYLGMLISTVLIAGSEVYQKILTMQE